MSISGLAALAGTVLTLAGCSAARVADRDGTTPVSAAAGSTCTQTVAGTLRSVALRIYDEAAAGSNVVVAQTRLARSAALAAAVQRNSPAATTAALRPLLKSQIHRIVVTRGGRVLAAVGRVASLAPTRGVIRDAAGRPVGRYAMAVGTDAGIAGITHAVTGEQIVMRAGAHQVASTLPRGAHPVPRAGTLTYHGVTYSASSFAGTAFPAGALQIWLLRPASAPVACAATASATTADAIGTVAQRLFRDEASGPATHGVLHLVAHDQRLVRAVMRDDPVALRAAIVALFRVHSLHVVRIRATTASGRLVNDVGGPFVLAPASTALRAPDGRVVGHLTLSVQDDTGYIKLVRRFTAADVLLHTATGVVPGSSPDSGAPAFSFDATAFPAGDLAVSLFLPTTSSVSSSRAAVRGIR